MGRGKEKGMVPCSVLRAAPHRCLGGCIDNGHLDLEKGKVYEKRWIGWGRGGLGGMGRYVIV